MSATPDPADSAVADQPRRASGFGWLAAIVCLAAGGAYYLTLRHSLAASERAECSIVLRRIGLALNAYHDLHGSFPPAHVLDKQGRPIQSWRMLILEQWLESTFEISNIKYRFDEPWNSPNNRKLVERWPTGLPYRCPSTPPNSYYTNYVMVTGPGLFSDGTHGSKRSDITDGLSQTAVIVEVHDSGIEWMEPRDLPYADFVAQVNRDPRHGISSPHVGGAMVLLADGTTRFLQDNFSPEELKAMLTIGAND